MRDPRPPIELACVIAAALLATACQDPTAERTPIPPSVTILQPSVADGTPTFVSDEGIVFEAQARDNYDAGPDLDIAWRTVYSDGVDTIDEDLGSSTADTDGMTTFITTLPAATHSVSVTVTDTDGLSASDTIDVLVLDTPVDEPPTVTINAPSDGETFALDEDIDFAATASDDGGNDLLAAEWRSNLDGVFDTAPPSSEGWLFVTTDALSTGDHTITLTVTDASNQSASDAITIHVSAAPGAPSQPTVVVTPSPATRSDDLLCTASGSVDPDGDAVTYLFNWLRDGAQTGNTSDTVSAADTALGEEWTCQVTPTDGVYEGPLGQDAATIHPDPGDILITEIAADTRAVDDSIGEWFEVYNNTSDIIDLYGWTIADAAYNETHVINDSVEVYPGHHVVLGRNDDMATNGGVPVDYAYSGISLDDTADSLVIAMGAVESDVVQYDLSAGWSPVAEGQPLMFDMSDLADDTGNDDPARWCGSTSSLGAGLDWGTPGDDNDDCACYDSDDDGDVFGDDPSCADDDCNDADAAVHPYAAEVCDGVADNDCDGTDDPDEIDDDIDGYSECGGDCDDGDAAVHPNAPEACDGVADNDCDGVTDANEVDADGDGYTPCDGDCDDGDASVRPGVTDLCDGIDNDCDGVDGNDVGGDPYENNDTRNNAYLMHANYSTGTVLTTFADVTIDDSSDEDWFYIYQDDPTGGNFHVTATISHPPGMTLEVYLYRDTTEAGHAPYSVEYEGLWYQDDEDNYYIRILRTSGTADPCAVYTVSVSSSG